jgi:type 1 glutamine amidotransferase
MPKALVTWGGWEGHQPKECSELFADLLDKEGFEVVRSQTLDSYLDAELMGSLDLIVQSWTMSEISKAQEQALLAAVERGVGFGGWHGGAGDCFRNSVNYQFMVGGQFVSHPGGEIDYSVQIVQPDDPIVAGLNDFAVHSEQYYLHFDPGVDVLAATTFTGAHSPWVDGVVMPVAWKKYWGAGRVFYCSLGHQAAVFDIPEAREITLRGLVWAAGAL